MQRLIVESKLRSQKLDALIRDTNSAIENRISKLEGENSRLREAIKKAPHDPMCGTRFVWDKPRCNCWKQAALAGEAE